MEWCSLRSLSDSHVLQQWDVFFVRSVQSLYNGQSVKWEEKKKGKTFTMDITADSDWQETDPTSRQTGRPTDTRQQISDRINIWSQVPK
jgi:hypothetical protein